MRYVGITIGTVVGILLAVGIIAFLPPGWPRAVGTIVAILFIISIIGSLPSGWPQVVGSSIGTIVAILIILVATGLLVISNAEETASPTSQPTAVATPVATPVSPTSTPEPTAMPSLEPTATPEPTAIPKPTATPLPTVPPTATVPPCTNGITVSNPQDTPGLVADCKALLQARDTLAGSATLNWSADLAITYWDGITVGGEPLRVTKVVLSDRKLSGTIPPELAALTNLQELDLHSNQLTGPIPSQLGTLTNLQGVFLAGNALTGCLPEGLRDVATNDFTKLEIPHCAAVAPTVYVGNTRGQGVFLRRTRNLADRITAYPDYTPLVVLGPDTSANGITWKHVRTPDGKVGYVPAQYTVPAAVAATPAAPLSATPTAPPLGTDRVARPVPTAAGVTAAAAQSRGCGTQNLRAFYARLKQDLSGVFPELVWTQTPGNTEGEARGLATDVILFDQGGPMAGDVDVELSLADFNRLSPQQQNRSVQLAYAAIHFKVFGALANSPHTGLLNWVSGAINSVTGTAYRTRTTTSFGCGHEVKVALLPTMRVLFFSAKSL